MTPLRFYAARTLRAEALLRTLSVGAEELARELDGRRVALVGNARGLADTAQGEQIDAADLVVRINRAPMPSVESHGARTDWLGLATRLPEAERVRLAPRRILWMSPKRKRLDYRSAHSAGFYLHPLPEIESLRKLLGAPPSTGAMLIALLLGGGPRRLALHGFDFFASRSLSGSRSARQVPHDFAAEAEWVSALLAADPRLELHPPG